MTHTNLTPTITQLRVIPVAGRDSMLLNLSGAHGPFFTRNILILTDSSGNTGIGEVPGGEKIRKTLEDARPWVEGQSIGNAKTYSTTFNKNLQTAMPVAAATKPLTCGSPSTLSQPLKAPC